jgi:hypothetical protein
MLDTDLNDIKEECPDCHNTGIRFNEEGIETLCYCREEKISVEDEMDDYS